MNKNCYYHSFKPDLGVDLRQGLGHEWGGPLTWVNVRTKIIIIIILKLDMGINLW